MSPDGQTTLALQTDGQLVLTHNGTVTWIANWTANRADHLVMQGDGNLVAYQATVPLYQGTTPLWYPALNTGYPLVHCPVPGLPLSPYIQYSSICPGYRS